MWEGLNVGGSGGREETPRTRQLEKGVTATGDLEAGAHVRCLGKQQFNVGDNES